MMIQNNVKGRAAAILLGAALAAPLTASGAGFALTEQGVKGLGQSFAGSAALGEDASTIFFNPAGMTRLEREELLVGMNIIDLRGDFTKESATDAIGQPISGGEGGDVGDGATPVPNLYYHRPLNDGWHFGIGVGAPFGLATSYEDDSIFRYQARRSDVSIININPSMAVELNDIWSLGIGFNLQYMDVELSNAVDYGAVCFSQQNPTTCSSLGLTPQSTDGNATITGDSVAYGLNAGLLAEFDSTRLGLHYRSQVHHDLNGQARFTNQPAAFNTGQQWSPFDDSSVTAEFMAPWSASLSFVHDFNEDWSLLGDVSYMGWDSFQELRINYDNPVQPDTVENQNYDNDMRYSLGLNYRYDDNWTLRVGAAYDESPVSDEHRTARLPDDDRTWLSIGATLRTSPNSQWDFGYAHLMLDDNIPLDHTGNQGDRIVGTYEVSANIVGVQYRYLFD